MAPISARFFLVLADRSSQLGLVFVFSSLR
jgi:hypothetical protein